MLDAGNTMTTRTSSSLLAIKVRLKRQLCIQTLSTVCLVLKEGFPHKNGQEWVVEDIREVEICDS